jgi:hypothetical protein
MSSEPFGFAVRRFGDDRWSVSLPHQCDSWDIAGEDQWTSEAVSRDEAARSLAQFIEEAQQALDALDAGR